MKTNHLSNIYKNSSIKSEKISDMFNKSPIKIMNNNKSNSKTKHIRNKTIESNEEFRYIELKSIILEQNEKIEKLSNELATIKNKSIVITENGIFKSIHTEDSLLCDSLIHDKLYEFCDKIEDKMESKMNTIMIELETIKLFQNEVKTNINNIHTQHEWIQKKLINIKNDIIYEKDDIDITEKEENDNLI